MLFILCIKFPPTFPRGLNDVGSAAVSACSCGLPVFDGKLKLDSNGVVGVVACDLTVGKGGKAQSWGMGITREAGRLGNGDVGLRRNGILNGDLGLLLWVAGDALRAVFTAIGFGKCWSDWRKESTVYEIVSLGIPSV